MQSKESLDQARFSTAQVAEAAGISANTLGAQIRRGEIVLAGDAPEAVNPGTGRSRLFTARRALHIALTQRLAKSGIPVTAASKLALAFTDHTAADDEAGAMLGDALPEPRSLGRPFAGDRTLLEIEHAGGRPAVRVRRESDVKSRPALCGSDFVAFVDLTALYESTLAKLGMTP